MDKGIVIAGATGEVGKRLVEKLIVQNPSTQIHVLVRKHSPLFHTQVQQHVVDFNDLEDSPLNAAFSLAICCLGTTIKQAGSEANFKRVDHDYVLSFARWAQHHGCREFAVISSVGANAKSDNFYLSVKGKMEHDLNQMKWDRLWLLRPSLLLGPRHEFRLGEYAGAILGRLISPFLLGSLSKYKPIHMLKVAQTLVNLSQSDVKKEGCFVLEGKALHKTKY